MNLQLTRKAIKTAARNLSYRTGAFIEGKFHNAESGKTFVTENPATGKPLAKIAECDAPDVDRAVKSARKAFESGAWVRMKPSERKKILLRFADHTVALVSSVGRGRRFSRE